MSAARMPSRACCHARSRQRRAGALRLAQGAPGPASGWRTSGWLLLVALLGSAALAQTGGEAFDPAAALAAEADAPAVARPRFERLDQPGNPKGRGTAFFLETRGLPGAVAVAPAHNFALADLSRAERVDFVLGASGARVSASSRFHAAPGRAFDARGASLLEDFILFALDLRPRGVRVLRAAPQGVDLSGQRVRVLGVPTQAPLDQDDIWGSVTEAHTEQIEVALDVMVDVRGWGGAPVLRHPQGDVIGMVQAARSGDGKLMVRLTPIGPILAAALRPLDGGMGRPFSAYLGSDDAMARAPRPRPGAPPRAWTPPLPAPTETRTPAERAAPPEAAGVEATAGGGAPPPAPEVEELAAEPPLTEAEELGAEPPLTEAEMASVRPGEGETLLGQAGPTRSELVVEIEQPLDGIVTGDVAGAFVAGRAFAAVGGFRKYDVMLVIDTSSSTSAMSGADINGNGVVGEGRLGNLMGGVFGGTDPGDSILSAEVAAAYRILTSLDPRNTRVGLVSFAGTPPPEPGFVLGGGPRRPDALVEQPLTDDFARVQAALQHVLARGPHGNTNMAEAVDRGYIELFGLRGAVSEVDRESEKVMLFFTDGQPTGPFDPSLRAANVEAVLRAAQRSKKLGVKIHSFAIGPDALAGPVAVVEMARQTGGYFTPVRNPGDLVAVIENVNLTQVAEIAVENLTTGATASELDHKADGSFAALVPLEPGRNRIRVRAVSREGAETSEEVAVDYAPEAPGVEVPREFMAARNELLERRLLSLRRERMGTEREAVDRARKELLVDIERERTEAESRAEEQRKRLDLEPVPEDEGAQAGDESG